MFSRPFHRVLVVAASIIAAGILWRAGLTAEEAAAKPDQPAKATTEKLGGADRFLTQLSTDKPIYRAGETVYLRGVVLRASDHKPLPAEQQFSALVEILGPKGETVASGPVQSQDSVLGFSWKVPEGQAGGEYTAKVTSPWEGHPPAERKFDIRVYRAPRLKSQIEFVRDGYGPADTVAASLHVERAEGGIPEGAAVTVLTRVDGAEVYAGRTTVDAAGNCSARFELPPQIARGEGTLAFVIEDGGVVETAAKTIPILLQTVDLAMYPEGGDLVAGLPNRVYIEARTPAQKPADIAGVVVDGEGRQVGKFRTQHEGRGRFGFTPEAGGKYALRITEPSGIATQFPLPELKAAGVVLSSADETSSAGEPVVLSIAGSEARRVKVTLSRREVEVAAKMVAIPADGTPARVELTPRPGSDGVLLATVWDESGRPLAERLVFRRPERSIRVSIEPDRERYVPGGKAKLTIRTTDDSGQPVAAVVGLTVTDDSVLEMIEKREQAPRLPVMVLLENDVRELADAHVYLDPENREAPLAVDLLLGTQGWRRFAFVETEKFLAENGESARRVLALKLASDRERQGGLIRRRRFLFFDAVEEFAAPLPAAAAAPEGAALEVDKALAPADPDQPADRAAGRAQAAGGEVRDLAKLQQALGDAEDKAGGLALPKRRKRLALDVANSFVYVREYAHAVRPDRQPGERVDFTETLYWHAGVRTDAKTGEAQVEFGLSDSVTSFRAAADAFDARGALGSGTAVVESVEPFYVEPKLPLELTSGDLVRLPVGLVNATLDPLSQPTVALQAQGLRPAGIPADLPEVLAADTRIRRLVDLDTTGFSGRTEVVLRAAAGGLSDSVARPLDVRPLGFPIEIARGGMLSAGGTVERELIMPQGIVPGSLKTRIQVFPTPLASLTGALERLLQEPSGCFEQTSSTTYPLVMAQQYFLSHTGIDPKLIARSNELLEKGYARLTSFECKGGGYEWFGEDPGHEALTAYGLMEFRDMAETRSVDPAMLQRTRTWLLGRRDGSGGFKRERRALHTWVADQDLSDAYLTWALLSAGESDLAKEIDQVERAAGETKNSYVLALSANVMVLAGRKEAATRMLDRLAELQTIHGDVEGATTSIVGSGGEALTIETTALATLAFLSDREYADFADKGIRYLAEVCKAGRFGSTQSTVLALKAIVAHDRLLARPKAAGSVQLLVDGKSVGEPVAFDRKTEGAIELADVASLMTPGAHTLAVQMVDGSDMPFSIAVHLYSTRPDSSDQCDVGLEVALPDQTVEEGAVTEARVVVTNRSDKPVPTPVAIIGLPGGLEVRHDQLKELVKSGKIAAYEVLGREVVLYWRDLDAKARVELPVSCVAAIPGRYHGPASRAYLYYTD
ncbi:MAG: A-macroglobulin complement component, partial [Planctomycetes bacterium]|nr:A-macroglobulin complement component [Planctomycetota bacterium]